MASPAPIVGPLSVPGFVTLDRHDGKSTLGAEASYLFPSGNGSDVTLLRLDAYARFMTPAGYGVYGQIPIAFASGSGDSVTAVGDIEVGGIYVVPVSATTSVVAHAGLTAPTASDSFDKAFVGIFASVSRLTDYYQFLPQSTSLRLGLSPIYRKDNLFLRVDAGADINLDIGGSDNTANSLVHLNVGVGVDTGSVIVAGELANLHGGDTWINVGAASVRLPGKTSPYAAVVVGLDSDATSAMDAAITAGVSVEM